MGIPNKLNPASSNGRWSASVSVSRVWSAVRSTVPTADMTVYRQTSALSWVKRGLMDSPGLRFQRHRFQDRASSGRLYGGIDREGKSQK
jgi:hypothetical protein